MCRGAAIGRVALTSSQGAGVCPLRAATIASPSAWQHVAGSHRSSPCKAKGGARWPELPPCWRSHYGLALWVPCVACAEGGRVACWSPLLQAAHRGHLGLFHVPLDRASGPVSLCPVTPVRKPLPIEGVHFLHWETALQGSERLTSALYRAATVGWLTLPHQQTPRQQGAPGPCGVPGGPQQGGILCGDHCGHRTCSWGQQALGTLTQDWSPLGLDPRTQAPLPTPGCGAEEPSWARPSLSQLLLCHAVEVTLPCVNWGHPRDPLLPSVKHTCSGQATVKRGSQHTLLHLTLALFKSGLQVTAPTPKTFRSKCQDQGSYLLTLDCTPGVSQPSGDPHTHFSGGTGRGSLRQRQPAPLHRP